MKVSERKFFFVIFGVTNSTESPIIKTKTNELL